MDYDIILRKLLTLKNGNPNGNKFLTIQKKYFNITEYIQNRWNDSLDIKESFHRIVYNIPIHPNCPVCGKPTHLGRRGQFSICCSHDCSVKYEGTIQKSKKTKLNRYGEENYNNPNKNKETCLKKYGVEYNFSTKQFRDKVQQTWLFKYGVDNPQKNIDIKRKTLETCKHKYNGIGLQSNILKEKAQNTCIRKYSVTNPGANKDIRQKVIKTNLERYGVECIFQRDDIKQKAFSKEALLKSIETKRKNHTFNTSSTEDKTYFILKEKYPDIIRQYHSKEYPYNCDFYIPSKDLYIECNYHWTHGGHDYNEELDKDKLNNWKSKGTKYYNNAIHTWTILDVKKRQIAKENNLNYIEIFKFDENFIKGI